MNTMQLVEKIPIDQAARATPQIKKYLLDVVREIRNNRNTIEQEARRQKKDEILDAYKKSVGYDKIESRLKKLRAEEEELKIKSLELGMNPTNGCLLDIDDSRDRIYVDGKWITVTMDMREKIKRVVELLKAVEKSVGTFSPMNILETRMMLASTVGEAMAIVNAVADKDVFKIDLGQLQLENKQGDKK